MIRSEYEPEDGYLAVITPDRYSDACNIMANHFTPDEPLCRAFQVSWSNDFETIVRGILTENLSICMIHKPTKEMMGTRLISSMRKLDPPFDTSTIKEDRLRALYQFLCHKDMELNICHRYGIDEAVHFYTLGVHQNYRRRGLGSKLLRAAVAMAKQLGFKGIKGEGTSNFTQRIYEKEGFETLFVMPYDSYLTPSGKTIREGSGEHTATKVYGLKL